jgi:hypothetical protein
VKFSIYHSPLHFTSQSQVFLRLFLTCVCVSQIRAIADESVRATGRQQNDIARLDSSFVALSAAVSDADVRHSRDVTGASIGDVERVIYFMLGIALPTFLCSGHQGS